MSGLSFRLRESPNVAQAAVLLGVVDAVAHDEAGFRPQPHIVGKRASFPDEEGAHGSQEKVAMPKGVESGS